MLMSRPYYSPCVCSNSLPLPLNPYPPRKPLGIHCSYFEIKFPLIPSIERHITFLIRDKLGMRMYCLAPGSYVYTSFSHLASGTRR